MLERTRLLIIDDWGPEPLTAEQRRDLLEIVDDDCEKQAFLAGVMALPIDWPEPFGLVQIEAMACGTPVIAWRRGSVPEVIEHGQTGFMLPGHTTEEAVHNAASFKPSIKSNEAVHLWCKYATPSSSAISSV